MIISECIASDWSEIDRIVVNDLKDGIYFGETCFKC